MASNVTTIKKRKLVPQELTKIGENAYNKMEKVNSELVSMAYGALVTQLLKDFEKVEDVNFQLEKMGYRIGNRLIDEYMSKTNSMSCETFQETAESIARIGFKIFLGITARVENCYKPQEDDKKNVNMSALTINPNQPCAGESFSLIFTENPLNDFVELPDKYKRSEGDTPSSEKEKIEQGDVGKKNAHLFYSNIFCGVIRGALEVIQMKCDCEFVKDQLLGDEVNEIKVTLKEFLKEIPPDTS